MTKSNRSEENIISYNIMIKKQEESHFHQDVELIYILEGDMELKVEGDVYNLKKDDVVVVNPNKKHSYHCSEDVLIGNFIISYQKLSSFLESNLILFWCNSTVDKETSFDEVRKITKLIINNFIKQEGKDDFYEHSLFYQLLSVLTNNFFINNALENFYDKDNKFDYRIDEIINYIRGNYNKHISLNDLADKLHLSSSYLSRYFKKNLGMNFIDYLNSIRLHHALEDLLYTDSTITRVALENGFPSTGLFNKLFKATYNMTPSEYIEKIKKKNDEITKENEPKEEVMKERLKNFLLENKFDDCVESFNNNKNIIADVKSKREYKKNWNKVITVGEASDLLHSDMQQHILILKNELKYEYIRFWSIFAQNMYVGIYNSEGKYNFDKIDKVLDFLVEHKIKPFIELRSKPKELNITEKSRVILGDELRSPAKVTEWESIIKAFTNHIVKRYGIKEAETWCFEILWYENLELFSDYFNVFNTTYKILKRYIPNCKIGGAGLGGSYGLNQLIKNYTNWRQFIIQSDFLSFSIFPYETINENGNKYFKRAMDKDFIIKQVKQIKKVLKDVDCNIKELYVTEWNSTVSERNYVNDFCFKGAYIMNNIIENIEEVEIMGYFIGSDLHSQFYDSDALINGCLGLISKNGIKKPSYYAIEFMNRLGGRIIDKGENYIITEDNDNEYFIACHNYKHFNYYYYLKQEDEVKPRDQGKIFNDYNTLHLNFKLNNMLNGQYSIKIYSINNEHGSVLDEWINLDEVHSLDKDEIDYLKRISTPRLTMRRCTINEELLELGITLAPHECNFIQISY